MMNDIEQAIGCVARAKSMFQDFSSSKKRKHEYDKHFDVALQALQEKAERDNPQPLTIEQLRQMDGEPVWVKVLSPIGDVKDSWFLIDCENREVELINSEEYLLYPDELNYEYGNYYVAYKYKPKEG